MEGLPLGLAGDHGVGSLQSPQVSDVSARQRSGIRGGNRRETSENNGKVPAFSFMEVQVLAACPYWSYLGGGGGGGPKEKRGRGKNGPKME